MRPHVVAWLSQFLPDSVAQLLAPGWFTCVGLAGVVGLFLALRAARRAGIERGVVASAVLWGYLAAVIAGIAMPIAIDCVQQYLSHGHFAVRWAGMTSFWGYLFGALAIAVVCHDHRVPLARFADLAAVPIGAALCFARLGCFLGGCDYGKVSSAPWAMRFPAGSPAWRDHVAAGLVPASRAESLPVHPTQLYESLLGLVIIGVAVMVARRARRRDGMVFAAAAATYAVGRLGVEALRGDAERGIYLGLSSGQIFCLLVLAAIAFGIVAVRRRAVALVAAAAALLVVIAEPGEAHAQPWMHPPATTPAPDAAPAPAPAPQPAPPTAQPQPYPPPQPGQPYPPPQPAQPYPPPAPANPYGAPPANPYPPPTAAEPRGVRISIGALLGYAVAVNRRSDQIPPLVGLSISGGVAFDRLGFWLDYDSIANTEASHGTILVSGGLIHPINEQLRVGARVGMGATLVNFKDAAFRDVSGVATRAEAIVEYGRGHWVAWARPLSFDLLTASELGGPIFTWQIRIGVAYRFGGTRSAAAMPPPAPAPATARNP